MAKKASDNKKAGTKTAPKKKAAVRKAGGKATIYSGSVQVILNVVATLRTLPSFSSGGPVPRAKVAQYAKLQGVNGKSTVAAAYTKLKRDNMIVDAGRPC